jgi:hypothetical protein
VVTTESAGRLIDDLIGTYLAGLAGAHARDADAARGPTPPPCAPS